MRNPGTATACCLLLAAMFSGRQATGANQAGGAAAVQRPELREELLERAKRDQEVRRKTLDWMKENNVSFDALPKDYLQQPVVQEETRVDRENREWLQTIVERHGWPGRSLVGVDGAHAAWLLAQHADHEFQRDCLRRMKESPAGEVAQIDLAYLTDRVLLAEGKSQIYGTQIEIRDGRWQPSKLEDPQNLDLRRKAIGLPPIAEYLQDAEEAYGSPGKALGPSGKP